MDYSAILFKFRSCMEEIGDALREVLGTNNKYKFTEIATSIKTCNQVYYLGTGTSFDVSGIPGYQNLTVDNFILGATAMNSFVASTEDKISNVSHYAREVSATYDATTGKLTVSNVIGTWYCSGDSNGHNYSNSGSITMDIEVYLVIGKIKNA